MRWLPRNLIASTIYYGLCTNERDFKRECNRLGIKDTPMFVNCGANATTHFFEHASGKQCSIVCMHLNKKIDILHIYALLVHEATHIWQHFCEDIGEDNPSSEFEAYSIQSISYELMAAYRKSDRRK